MEWRFWFIVAGIAIVTLMVLDMYGGPIGGTPPEKKFSKRLDNIRRM